MAMPAAGRQLSSVAVPSSTANVVVPHVRQATSASAGVSVVTPQVTAPTIMAPSATALPQAAGAASVVQAPLMVPMLQMSPAKLTEGMPNPQDVAQQKQEFNRQIMVQHNQAQAVLQQQADYEIQHARSAAERYKALVLGRLEVQMREEELAAEHEYHNQLAYLREEAARKRAAVEQQAADLVIEYTARAAQGEINRRNHQMQYGQWEARRQEQLVSMPTVSESGCLQSLQQHAAQPQHMNKRADAGLPELPVNGWVPDGIIA